MTSRVLCDRRMSVRLVEKCYNTIVQPTRFYGSEFWATTGLHKHKMVVAEIRMLRWMYAKRARIELEMKRIRAI